MGGNLITLDVRTRAEWRQWLAEHHASSPGIWLVRHKQHAGVESMPYEDLVCEALCFGWIDSLIKRLDEDRYVIKVTGRKGTSKWSDINRKRWKQLKAAGLLAPPRAGAPNLDVRAVFVATSAKAHRILGTAVGSRRGFLGGTGHGGRRASFRRRLADLLRGRA